MQRGQHTKLNSYARLEVEQVLKPGKVAFACSWEDVPKNEGTGSGVCNKVSRNQAGIEWRAFGTAPGMRCRWALGSPLELWEPLLVSCWASWPVYQDVTSTAVHHYLRTVVEQTIGYKIWIRSCICSWVLCAGVISFLPAYLVSFPSRKQTIVWLEGGIISKISSSTDVWAEGGHRVH